MSSPLNRRAFVKTAATSTLASGLVASIASQAAGETPDSRQRVDTIDGVTSKPPIIKHAVKWGMVQVEGSIRDRFAVLKDLGYDGVELDSPKGPEIDEIVAASKETGLPVHGVVDSIHWSTRLSDPDPEVRQIGVDGLKTAIRDSKGYGGSSVLLVPGAVRNAETENSEQVWDRSIHGLRECLPLAAELGIHILIENVWNGFLYTHNGPPDQTADELARYIDAINSPWVGSYFDIGNHRKYGVPEEWIRTLGKRIVKLDVKDWGVANGWSPIGEGDVNWPAVVEALGEIGFTGWATAEVKGGDRERLEDVKRRMDQVLGS